MDSRVTKMSRERAPARFSILSHMKRRQSLVWELTKREFITRYNGSVGGLLWSFVQPIFLLSVYTLAFGVILKARWGFSGSTLEYALMLFAGLIVYNAFADCLGRAPNLIVNNPNFVTKVVFPLELLPVVQTNAAMIHAVIAVLVWLVGHLFLFGLPPVTALYFPIILLAYYPMLVGISLLLSALTVFVRDIIQFAALLSHATLFLTPIFYSIDVAPESLRPALILNPLTFIVTQLRSILREGVAPDFAGLAIYLCCGLAFAGIALFTFNRLRLSFADSL